MPIFLNRKNKAGKLIELKNLLKRGQVREGRDMYARACELESTNSWIQKHGHLFQDAAQQTRHVQTRPETQSRRNLQAPLSKTCAEHVWKLMLNPFVCYTLNTDSVDMDTNANTNMSTRRRAQIFQNARQAFPPPNLRCCHSHLHRSLPRNLLCLSPRCQPAQSHPYITTSVKSTYRRQ
jgi:hypothetical protein